ncbi:multi-sensor hybrid histidine kinase [Ectopseudomonas oleovorans]|uniref:response regulator n=1 Tax=Ectopseudomonas oleovorans TaxID=301 RepID=UPI0008D71D98|nr:response regulator [Pseudomonas oleovorans]SEJ92629.1 multi-sensor hybrid histidine kinase [Pseudomonas oleovorans]
MFKDLSIRGRVLLLTLLPTSLLALVLGGYFTWVQLSGLQTQLLQRGEMLVEHLAPLSAPALHQQDVSKLERIARQALEHPDVRAVALLTPERTPLAYAGPSMLNLSPASQPTLNRISGQDATRFLLPIYDQHLALSDDQADEANFQLLGWVELELSHQGTLLSGYRSLFASLLLIIGGLALTAMLALRMSRSIIAPLHEIKAGVAQLKDGHLQTRLPPLGSHEMDELAAGINRMAEALQNAQEELQHSIELATEDVRQNLETIEIQNIELDFARKEALEASRIKSEFLANMSHEIRTPLNGILGFTNLLQKSELSPRQRDYLATIENSADNLLGIINEVLDFSKIEAGKLVLESIPFNLRDLLQDTLTILAPAAHEKRLELVSLVYRDTPLALRGDPLRLKQVLTNLVSNAIKFTHEGTIVMRAMVEDERADSAQLRISVMDTGIGLSAEDLRALFQAFSQADNSLSRQAGGTGLGLVIPKRLIEQMGGEIGVDSTPGEGSEFWITLTLPKARDDTEDLPRASLQGRRVAVLESHELARKALAHQLEDCGLEVESFADPAQLFDAVNQQQNQERPLSLAVLGITASQLPPDSLGQRIEELDRLGCKALVLCPTTELGLFHDSLPDAYAQLQAKPPCTRKLHKALVELVNPPRTSTEPVAIGDTHRPQILCVDDNPANLLLVQTLLDDLGAQVTAVDSGYAAIEAVQHGSFDLVFMDVQMPGMDGREATEAIRQWESEQGRSATPIIALTAHALANEKRALLQSGMDDYLTKPINERQLAQVVLKWTGLNLRNQPNQRIAPAAAPQSQPKVLDAEEGLRLAAGKADLAADMLSMLLAGLPGDRQAIRQARDAGERTALIERVHRLHGATRYCGVPQLRLACQRSETLLKQDDPEAQRALDELDAAIARLTEAAAQSA